LPDSNLQIVGPTRFPNTGTEECSDRSDGLCTLSNRLSLSSYGSCGADSVRTGVQNKVIEAFLTGTPVVATSMALRGLNVTPGEHVLVGDTPRLSRKRLLCYSLIRSGVRRLALRTSLYRKEHNLVETTGKLVAFTIRPDLFMLDREVSVEPSRPIGIRICEADARETVV